MNNTIQLLDVSLRDGGHRTNFHFEDRDLKAILPALDRSGIEYIEVGYRNTSLNPTDNFGRAGCCTKDYLLFCRSLVKNAEIAVLAHPENVSPQDIVELKNCGVNMLRIFIAKGGLATAIPTIEMAKKAGLKCAANFVLMSHYDLDELDQVVEQVSQCHPDVIYFADSNGSVLPERIKNIYERYTKHYTIPFGFHAHDNLGLAQANALVAMDSGVRFIDASLAGMGKGIGNLKTEFFTAYLHAINIKKYDLGSILEASNYVRDALKIGHESIDMDEFIRGVADLSNADLAIYKEKQK